MIKSKKYMYFRIILFLKSTFEMWKFIASHPSYSCTDVYNRTIGKSM